MSDEGCLTVLRVEYRQSFALLFEDPGHFQGPGGSRQRILLKSLMLKQQSQPPSRKGKSYKENAIQYECFYALIFPLFRLKVLHDYISCKRNNTERKSSLRRRIQLDLILLICTSISCGLRTRRKTSLGNPSTLLVCFRTLNREALCYTIGFC